MQGDWQRAGPAHPPGLRGSQGLEDGDRSRRQQGGGRLHHPDRPDHAGVHTHALTQLSVRLHYYIPDLRHAHANTLHMFPIGAHEGVRAIEYPRLPARQAAAHQELPRVVPPPVHPQGHCGEEGRGRYQRCQGDIRLNHAACLNCFLCFIYACAVTNLILPRGALSKLPGPLTYIASRLSLSCCANSTQIPCICVCTVNLQFQLKETSIGSILQKTRHYRKCTGPRDGGGQRAEVQELIHRIMP